MEKTTKSIITKGLVLGKFAPLHKGHQYLIETARAQCDRLYVLVYDSRDVIDIPLHVRADWIRTLHPDVIVIEGWDGPSDSGKADVVKKLQEDYIARVLPEPITHFFSSEWYGEHVSKALNARNVVVDMDRKKFPCSGTLIRSNPHKYKKWLDPYVYKDFVELVVLLGAESTGKSTLAKELAKAHNTVWMPEHGREFWMKHKDENGRLNKEKLVQLAKEHLEQENELLLKANTYLFVDTNAITTYMFSLYYHKSAHPELSKLARLAQERYHHWFVCDTDIPYDDDGTRSGEEHRLKFQNDILQDLHARGIRYRVLQGSIQDRIDSVASSL